MEEQAVQLTQAVAVFKVDLSSAPVPHTKTMASISTLVARKSAPAVAAVKQHPKIQKHIVAAPAAGTDWHEF
ncbi:hypothetical protein VDP41_21285 [Xanthomonas campestris pv. campestris]|nr:hypothetical protein [Xanthomonas campestris pv. campestris]